MQQFYNAKSMSLICVFSILRTYTNIAFLTLIVRINRNKIFHVSHIFLSGIIVRANIQTFIPTDTQPNHFICMGRKSSKFPRKRQSAHRRKNSGKRRWFKHNSYFRQFQIVQ